MPAPAIIRVRIRGIYATALTKIVLDEGFQVVQPSRIIADRFHLPELRLPADVTIKTSDQEPSEIVVVGYEGKADRVLSALQRHLRYSFYWVSRLPLHSTVKATIKGRSGDKCIAEVGGIEAELLSDECIEGRNIVASVVRPGVKPFEKPRLVPGARVIGDYAIVYEQSGKPRVTISEHVRSTAKRAELAALASLVTSKGLSVHWRSSSQHADQDTLRAHLEDLIKALTDVKRRAEEGEPGKKYSIGELVAVARLSSIDKEYLDSVRDEVVPTIRFHHSAKSMLPSFSNVVDYAEKLKQRGVDEDQLVEALLDLVLETYKQKHHVRILHVKPSGEVIELGTARLKNIYRDRDAVILILERMVKHRGVYDGLGAEKEPGDRIVTEINTREWTIRHTYYSASGEPKGIYININTPPEFFEDGIIYHDLEIDVVKTTNGEAKIIDKEELDKAFKEGIITAALYEKALEEAQKAAAK